MPKHTDHQSAHRIPAVDSAKIGNSSVKHLAELENHYRSLLKAPDAMTLVSQQGLIFVLNAQAETQFGYRRDELLRQPITDIIPSASPR